MKTFKTAFLALIATAFVFAGCGAFTQTPQEKEETSNLVTNSIENGDIYIVIDRIQLNAVYDNVDISVFNRICNEIRCFLLLLRSLGKSSATCKYKSSCN